MVNAGLIPTGPTHGEVRPQPLRGVVLKSTPNVRTSPRSGLNLGGRRTSPMAATCNNLFGVYSLTKQAHRDCLLASPYAYSYGFVGLTSKCWFCCELMVQVPEPAGPWGRSNDCYCRSAKTACRLEAVCWSEEWFGVYLWLSLNNKPFDS